MSAPSTQRLFLALWPSTQLGREIAQLSEHAVGDGRPVAPEKIHLTLQFLGEVPVARVGEITAALDRVSSPSFDLVLNRFGYWHRNRVVWLGSSRQSAPLLDLVSVIAGELRRLGFKRERRVFHGHLTVARKCRQPGSLRLQRRLEWPVPAFSLIASTLNPQGALYEPLHTRPLT